VEAIGTRSAGIRKCLPVPLKLSFLRGLWLEKEARGGGAGRSQNECLPRIKCAWRASMGAGCKTEETREKSGNFSTHFVSGVGPRVVALLVCRARLQMHRRRPLLYPRPARLFLKKSRDRFLGNG
jgi:hypothetical protein